MATFGQACPFCIEGHIYHAETILDTCPEVEPDIAFIFTCNKCKATANVYLSSQIEKGHHYISDEDIRSVLTLAW